MNATFQLGRYRGIDIGIHWSVALIAFLAGSTIAGTVLPTFAPGHGFPAYLVATAGVVVALLASILAHELGHSVVAQRNGLKVPRITLFALGGVAALDSEPANPGAAGRIALAGPAVSVAIAAIMSGLALLILPLVGAGPLLTVSILWIGVINASLAVFNMIPALPLDGGRVLQAFLWHRNGNRYSATIKAARLGRFLGWAMIAYGVWSFATTGQGLLTILIGWFVARTARSESRRARVMLGQHWLADVLANTNRTQVPPSWYQSPWDQPGFRAQPGFKAHPGFGDGFGGQRGANKGPTDVIDVEGYRVSS